MQYHPISTLQPTVIPDQQQQAQQQAQLQYNQQLQQSQQQQQVPFGTLPTTQPGSLSYGFGLSQASNFNTWNNQPTPSTSAFGSYRNTSGSGSNSIGFGSIRQPQQQHQTITPLSNLTTNSPNNSRRRRRSLSVEEDERDYNNSSFDGGINNSGGRNIGGGSNRILKRVKVLEDVKSFSTNGSQKDLAKEGVDLGKALASLPKESLLKILTSLVTTSPTLIPTIQSLLPPPTLTQTLLTLSILERTILQTIPTSTTNPNTRIDYIYGRIRIPLEEYILECKSFLNAFCSPNTILSSSTGAGGGEDEIGHPSTTFSLLHALASSLRRLELALPSPPLSSPSTPSQAAPLSIHLLPLLINSFHIFITKLSTSVNGEGKILSGSILRNWFERLDMLCVSSPNLDANTVGGVGRREGAAKKALEGVRDRMRREIGWVVGLREVVQVDASGRGDGMEEEEL